MKKLLLFLLFTATILVSQAQNKKPTKEETIKYLNTLAQGSLGKSWSAGEGAINFVQITDKSVTMQTVKGCVRTWNNIPWHEYDSSHMYQNKMIVSFKQSMLTKYACPDVEANNSKQLAFEFNDPEDSFYIFLASDKMENFKKAIHRLSEIAKEENKDPFKN